MGNGLGRPATAPTSCLAAVARAGGGAGQRGGTPAAGRPPLPTAGSAAARRPPLHIAKSSAAPSNGATANAGGGMSRAIGGMLCSPNTSTASASSTSLKQSAINNANGTVKSEGCQAAAAIKRPQPVPGNTAAALSPCVIAAPPAKKAKASSKPPVAPLPPLSAVKSCAENDAAAPSCACAAGCAVCAVSVLLSSATTAGEQVSTSPAVLAAIECRADDLVSGSGDGEATHVAVPVQRKRTKASDVDVAAVEAKVR
jgi:hypothetical protein